MSLRNRKNVFVLFICLAVLVLALSGCSGSAGKAVPTQGKLPTSTLPPGAAPGGSSTGSGGAAPSAASVSVIADVLNVRDGPDTIYTVLTTANKGESLSVLGRNGDGTWLNIKTASGVVGWVSAELVSPVAGSGAEAPPSSQGASAGRTAVSRAAVQSTYEGQGFKFAEGAPVDGQPQVVGKIPGQESTVVRLVGPADNVVLASISVSTAKDDENTRTLNLVYLSGLSANVAPAWEDGPTWISDNVKSATDTGAASTTYGNWTVSLTADRGSGNLTLAFRSQ